MVILFQEFGCWLLSKVGPAKAAMTIHRYLPFFIELEREWCAIPTYNELLKHFGAEGLRRVRLPMKWLVDAKGVILDVGAREADSEARRINAIMALVPHKLPAAQALREYKEMLIAKVMSGKTTTRSARLALSPAASLLLTADSQGAQFPNQVVLDKFLHNTPGQKAAVTGFINFLNKRYSLGLAPKVNKQRVKDVQKRKLEIELMALMCVTDETETIQQKWISVALAYFHGLPRKAGLSVRNEQLIVDGDGLEVSINACTYWIPRYPSHRVDGTTVSFSSPPVPS